MTHDHVHPAPADMRTALAITRTILETGSLADAHQAAVAAAHGTCPVCIAVAGISFGITLASTVAGDQAFTSEPVRLALLAAVDVAEDELRGAPN